MVFSDFMLRMLNPVTDLLVWYYVDRTLCQ